MQQRILSNVHADLDAFLAAHGGRPHAGDVGPLLGVAAWLLDRRAADGIQPAQWQEAVNAALAVDVPVSSGRAGTRASRARHGTRQGLGAQLR